MESQSLLLDIFIPEIHYTRASHLQRLGNYIIDIIVYYLLLILVGIFIGIVYGDIFVSVDFNDPFTNLLDKLASLFLYGLYMGGVEVIFKGRSIGKFITNTKAINTDGTPISSRTAFLRGLSRAVPFEAFSALGSPSNPWHDRWNETMVVKNTPTEYIS